MKSADAPIAKKGFFVTHFLTVKDQAKSKEFYVGILVIAVSFLKRDYDLMKASRSVLI